MLKVEHSRHQRRAGLIGQRVAVNPNFVAGGNQTEHTLTAWRNVPGETTILSTTFSGGEPWTDSLEMAPPVIPFS